MLGSYLPFQLLFRIVKGSCILYIPETYKGYFFWKGGGTHLKNSNKPFHALRESYG